MMDFSELIKRRYSCRQYKSDPVEEDKLMKLLEAVRVAPSAVNYQPYRFIVVRMEEHRQYLCDAYHRTWIKEAPVIIVACIDHGKAWKRALDGRSYADMDLAIAIDHLTLQATALGLATCWVCNFNPEICVQELDLPEGLEPAVLIPLGYPVDEPDITRHERKRKSLFELILWEKYEEDPL